MNCLVISTICLIIPYVECLSKYQRTMLKQMHVECLNETKVDPDLVVKLKSGQWNTEDEKLKRWLLCILVKSDLMTSEGKFRMDIALGKIEPEDKTTMEKAISACSVYKSTTPHETAWNLYKCYLKIGDPKYFLI